MDFMNSFSVEAPLPVVWEFLLNTEEVAPCVPGAQITETINQLQYKGTVKIKLGAVQMTYRGDLTMEPDEAHRTIVLRVKGTDIRGNGGASGTITNRLEETTPGTTEVQIHSEINVTGKIAQFGRGIMQDVATRLIGDFSRCLEAKLKSQAEGERPAESAQPPAGVEAEPPPSTPSPPIEASPLQTTQPVTTYAPPSTYTPSSPASELSLHTILIDVARARTAGLLRGIAARIDPSQPKSDDRR